MKNITYISASAGSGKTYSLTQTLTNAIKNKEVEPENVILTTFTRPAAAEFKEKAKAMLYEKGLITAADRLDQALIGTIHSVAEAFIHKYWYVLGLSPHITPITEDDEQFFRNQSLSNLLKADELQFLNKFAEEFNIREQRRAVFIYDFWKNDLSKILEYTKNYQITDYKPSIEYSKEMTRSLVLGGHRIKVDFDLLEEILNQATIENDADASDQQIERRRDIEAQRRLMKTQDPASIRYIKNVSEFVKKLPAWEKLKDLKSEFLESLAKPYASENVREWLNQYIETIFSLAERWNDIYQKYKTEHNLIDFADMETYFYKLLHNQEVADDIKKTYKYVFVDEFQDCSPIQVLIFDRLSEIVEHSYWVGDKKQAIFGFRGTDSTLTTSVMDIIKDNEKKGLDGCSTDILKFSYRSLPAIVNFTNKVYAKGFSDEPEDEVCLTAKRNDAEGSVSYWWLPGTNQQIRAAELTANIIDLIKKGEKPSDIAILARYNKELEAIAEYLRNANVPVYIDEAGQFGSDTVSLVKDLLQLVVDDTAELPKAEIAFLTEKKYKLEKIIDDKIEYNMASEPASLFYDNIPLVKKLFAERDRYRIMSIPALVESLIIELDLFNVAKKLNDNADTAKLLHAIIDAAGAYEDYCALMHLPSSVLGFITYLSENDISVSGSTEGVQLYTYHRSKGLEWKTVIVTGCEKDILDTSTFLKFNLFGTKIVRVTNSTKEKLFPEVRISVLPNLFFGNTRVAEEWVTPIESSQRYKDLVKSSKAELMRLMYVAMTRPRDRLIIILNGSRYKVQTPLLTFTQLGYQVATNFEDDACDLFGVGVISKKLDNADPEITYDCEEENLAVDIAGKPAKNPLDQYLSPSGIEGDKITVNPIDCGTPITVIKNDNYDPAALGTCIHDIFCVVDHKTDAQIAEMVKAYGFESNLPKAGEIRASWEALTAWLTQNYGTDKKQYHELPFKHQLKNGQIVTGSMDFVWETADGCVLVDYKTSPCTRENLINKESDVHAGKYKGQLECYEQALIAAGKKVLAKVLYYPVVGVLVKL